MAGDSMPWVTLELRAKRLKERGSDWQPQIDCCPKYSSPAIAIKDSRPKRYSKNLLYLELPHDVGEIEDTSVVITELAEDSSAIAPFTAQIFCK